MPRSESDQRVVDGWPLYRTERGQQAFNDAMAALKATDGAAPSAAAFRDCPELSCSLALPAIGADGWVPAGRIWTSPNSYVLIAHSPRGRAGQTYRRRSLMSMRVFVFHEFHNSSRNVDLYDTISSHSRSTFVPFYMSKQTTDARGRRFVIIEQVAPYDVVSIHATNHGSNGPGIEVAKNSNDALDPMQAEAGILIATIVSKAAPLLRVVNHRGNEGLALLQAFERQRAAARGKAGRSAVALPFTPALSPHVATASARHGELILAKGASPRIPIAERPIVPPKPVLVRTAEVPREARGAIDMAAGASTFAPTQPTPARFLLIEPARPAPRPVR